MAVTWKKLAIEDEVLLITGATTGATVQAQTFTNGVVSPHVSAVTDGTTAFQIRKQDKTTGVVTVDTTNSRVGIGITPQVKFHVSLDGNALSSALYSGGETFLGSYSTNNNFRMVVSSDTAADVASFVMLRARGTLTTPTIVSSGDYLGTIIAQGYDGTTRRNSAAIYFIADGSTSSGVMPGAIYLRTSSAATLIDRVKVASDGLVTAYSGMVINENGGAAATDDLRAESDTEANMLWLDASADLLYLGGSTNGVKIAKGGDLTLIGTAKYERHVQISARLSGPAATQPTSEASGTAGGLQFSSAVAQYAFCQWEIPDDWDGTDVYIEVDWFPDSGAISGTAAVRWTAEYRSIAEGETVTNGTSVTLDNGAGGDTADYAQYVTKHTRMTLTYNNANQPLTAQDHVYFKIGRDVSVANDFTGTVTVTAFEIIYNSKGFPTN